MPFKWNSREAESARWPGKGPPRNRLRGTEGGGGGDRVDTDTRRDDNICQPQCKDRDCGSDGCGGSCGTCLGWLVCTEQGMCSATACGSSKDCPQDLVG